MYHAIRFSALIGGMMLLGACASNVVTSDVASRAEPFSGAVLDPTNQQIERPNYVVRDVAVRVPNDLVVSEANSYYPFADIVWRGDALGDRRAQVATIIKDSFVAGTASLDGDTPVIVTLTLRRFHSLTERTRYTIGGVHSIKFDLVVNHAETGELLEGPRLIDADLTALGGQGALRAEQNGEGQKVRITRHLTSLALLELGPVANEAPAEYVNY